jgi:colanic acid/amylovoran biosynthesis protein
MKKLNILLIAYLDQNVGDDLFIHYFCSRYIDHSIWLIGDRDFCLNTSLQSLNNLNKINLKSALKSLFSMDALVLLGGSIFQDNPEYYKYDYRRNILVTLARIFGKKIYIMGCNIGPVKTLHGERLIKYCISMANGIAVRDSCSLQLLKKWGLDKKAICAPDMIFSYPMENPVSRQAGRLGISVINREGHENRESYIGCIVKIASAFLKKAEGNELRLYAFDGGNENDVAAADAVFAQLTPAYRKRTSVCAYNVSMPLEAFVADFCSCSYVIGTRFHSIVLALKYGIKFLPVAYSIKTQNLLKDINYSGLQCDYSSLHKLNLDLIMADIFDDAQPLSLADGYMSSSVQHFNHLDSLVNS